MALVPEKCNIYHYNYSGISNFSLERVTGDPSLMFIMLVSTTSMITKMGSYKYQSVQITLQLIQNPPE